MLNILNLIERTYLPELLLDESCWKSVFVDYHPPFVERLWTTLELDGQNYRIYLHRIHPCALKDSLFHPHPWPSAMRILSGSYTMTTGYGPGMQPPVASEPITLGEGYSYEMTNMDEWHAVSPNDTPAYSLMVTGTPWSRESHASTHPLGPLPDNKIADIFEFFRSKYPQNTAT